MPPINDTVTAVMLWLGLAVAVGILAARFNRSGPGWFVLSMLLSPLIACALVLALGRRADDYYVKGR
jgi:putative effector of murein hydrolase